MGPMSSERSDHDLSGAVIQLGLAAQEIVLLTGIFRSRREEIIALFSESEVERMCSALGNPAILAENRVVSLVQTSRLLSGFDSTPLVIDGENGASSVDDMGPNHDNRYEHYFSAEEGDDLD